jgi:hypothetical protein
VSPDVVGGLGRMTSSGLGSSGVAGRAGGQKSSPAGPVIVLKGVFQLPNAGLEGLGFPALGRRLFFQQLELLLF